MIVIDRHARPCRASTSYFHERKDVDGRDKPGHDENSNTFLFRTHFARVLEFRFSVGQDLFCINESLTLDSAKKTDSNRCDSEAVGVLPRERNKKIV